MKKLLLLFFALLCLTGTAKAATPELSFDELYSGGGVLGLQFSDKVKNLAGQRITIRGFMAPPLKAEAAFFVLTREPVALCPFCQSDADWPDNILVVYLSSSQSFVQNIPPLKWRACWKSDRTATETPDSSASSGCGTPASARCNRRPKQGSCMNGLELQDILLTFPEGGRRRTVLDIPYLKVTSGEHIGIRGASGSGKSSLLNVVSGLVLPDRGTVRWGATVPGALSEHERDRWRGQHIGFVFQDFQLFPELEALENVLLPATFTGWRIPEALIRRGRGLLEQMHVCPTRKVRALSRGEKQRVAIARAVLLKPGIILADEPTASLDEANAGQVTLLLSGYARTLGSTLLVVSHDDAVLADMDRVLDLNRGIVREAA